jgi:hypothetical protein
MANSILALVLCAREHLLDRDTRYITHTHSARSTPHESPRSHNPLRHTHGCVDDVPNDIRTWA